MDTSGEWARFGLDEDEAGALLTQADDIAGQVATKHGLGDDPDVRADLSQEALYEALRHLDTPPDGMPDSGLSRLRWLSTAMWRAANRFCSRKAFDTPLDHSGRPHQDMKLTEYQEATM